MRVVADDERQKKGGPQIVKLRHNKQLSLIVAIVASGVTSASGKFAVGAACFCAINQVVSAHKRAEMINGARGERLRDAQ